MNKLINYTLCMKYVPDILKMLRKGKDGTYYVNMQLYGNAGFTFLGDNEFKLLQTAIRAITKQDELTLDYHTYLAYADATITDEDIVEMEGDCLHVVWNKKKQEYV